MPGSRERVAKAFEHVAPDRTPLFEIFCQYHPIYWDVCGRNPATDARMHWDALAEGITWEELIALEARAAFEIHRHFGVDMVRLGGSSSPDLRRPVKTGPDTWELNGAEHFYNERTNLVEPSARLADSEKQTEEQVRAQIDQWDGSVGESSDAAFVVFERVKARAAAEGLDWVYMGEVGAGTGTAFWPPFMLMWLATDPGVLRAWVHMQKASAFARTRDLVARGCTVIAMGGDVGCDKGSFISPSHYREFVLPTIQEHVDLIHDLGALAVYTSDGNHWDIAEEFFFDSRADGYKEVDKAAGMTWPRLMAAGVSERVCIIGNMDARHTMCLGTVEEVRAETIECLQYGQQSPGGHILHLSHSVHEDVKVENYHALVVAYREYFGIG